MNTSIYRKLVAMISLASFGFLLFVPKPVQAQSNGSRRTFTVNNDSGQAIQRLYLSPASDSSWGSNDISSDLYDGNSVAFNIIGNCTWDLRVTFSNGQSFEQMGIDTCLNSSYSVALNQDFNTQQQVIRPSASAGSYWIYQKPSNISDSQMQSAGASFYPGPQACSIHYSLCTYISGVWLSQQNSLVIREIPQQRQAEDSRPQSEAPRGSLLEQCIESETTMTLVGLRSNGGGFLYDRPEGISSDQMRAAGLTRSILGKWWSPDQTSVRIQLRDFASAAEYCREALNG